MISRSVNSVGSTHTHIDTYPTVRFLAGRIQHPELGPIDSFRRKAICPAGYVPSHRWGSPWAVSQISWYIHEQPCAARVSGHCVRRASVTRALCARNNRCIIRFQSGLGVICIDLLSSHRPFGPIAGTYVLLRFASRVYARSSVAHVSRATRPAGGNVKRPRSRSSQLSRHYLFKGGQTRRGRRFDFRHARERPWLAQAESIVVKLSQHLEFKIKRLGKIGHKQIQNTIILLVEMISFI